MGLVLSSTEWIFLLFLTAMAAVSADSLADAVAEAGPAVAAEGYRNRLLEGMARCLASQGYADTTVADIVREAGVSKRTFYEQFSTKSDCLIALYNATSGAALKVLKAAVDPGRDWATQVDHALQAYLGCLARNPQLLRTLFIEILHSGAEGLAARRKTNEDLAGFVVQVVTGSGQRPLPDAALAASLAMAVVGGIHELVLHAIERNRTESLTELVGPAATLVRSVLSPLR